MDFLLTGGQTYDAKVAVELLKKVDISGSHILADKAYGAASIREYISEHGGEYTIPPRRNIKEPWEYDRERYKHRQRPRKILCKLLNKYFQSDKTQNKSKT